MSVDRGRLRHVASGGELEKPMFLSVVIFGSNRNNGIFVQLSETSSALSVDTVQSTSCLAQ